MMRTAIPDYRNPYPILANTGGPGSRTRTEHISSSILGKDDGSIRCPKIIRLGLTFKPRSDPLNVLGRILESEGYSNPEELRDAFLVPGSRLICRPCKDESFRIDVATSDSRLVLEQALLLGLCTAQLFDPSRPVLWTGTSVTRALELFDPAGFYA
jgi:hypothetical protein